MQVGTITSVRIAVLADVHGNLAALEAVLEDLEELHVDLVVVNGDSVNRGPQSVEVARLLATLPYRATLGNHDDLMVMLHERDPALGESLDDPFWAGNLLTAQALATEGLLSWIRALPMTVRIAEPNHPVVLVSHGSPRHYREGYGPSLTAETISEIVEDHPADYLIGSHTHRPHLQRWARYAVLNSGSVGAPFNGDPRAQYLVLTGSTNGWLPEFRRVPYDQRRTLAAYDESGLLDAGGLSARIFRDELLHARSFIVPFLMRCEEGRLTRDERGWGEYRRLAAARFELPRMELTVQASATP